MMLMTKATHLIKVWFYDKFPENWTKEMVYAAMLERFKHLGDKLENVIVESLSDEKVPKVPHEELVKKE